MSTQVHALPSDRLLEVTEPRLRRFYSYWLERKGSRRFPARDDIDPVEFPYVLGNIMLLEVLRDPLRFRVRVHGSHMAARAHYDLTGKLLDDLPISDYRSYVIGRCRKLVETGEPVVVYQNRVIDGESHRYEAVWVPLSDNGATVTQLICALVYQDGR